MFGALSFLLVACSPDDEPSESPDPIPEVPSETGATEETGSTTTEPTGSTSETGRVLETFDCALVPDNAAPPIQLDAPRGYNDLIFTADGEMVGGDGDVMVKATSPDDATVWVPNLGTIYKMGVLPDGDVVVTRAASAGGGVTRIAPDGGGTVIDGSLLGYGLAVGNDGKVYVAANYTAGLDGLFRVDPDGGGTELLIDLSAQPPRDIAFSRDFSKLYFGTLQGGDVWAVNLDANLDPVGAPELVTTVPDGWHDTVEVDACGNLYVGSVFASAIFRIRSSDGSIEKLLDWDFQGYGHGATWGAHGWNEQSMYVTHPYVGSRVTEVDVGVPGAHWVGEVLGGSLL